MKKLSLAMLMLLTFGLVFTSCKQQDADMTLSDLDNTDWLLGTWEMTSTVDYNITGADAATEKEIKAATEKAIKENFMASPTTSMTVTKVNVRIFAGVLKGYVQMAGKEVPVPDGKSTISVKINKAKTKVSIYTDTEVSKTIADKKVNAKISIAVTYTKK